MPKLRLHQAPAKRDEAATPNPYRFPVEAARQLGGAATATLPPAAGPGKADVIAEIEQALDRMHDQLEDLSEQVGSLPFPGGREDEPPRGSGPSAA